MRRLKFFEALNEMVDMTDHKVEDLISLQTNIIQQRKSFQEGKKLSHPPVFFILFFAKLCHQISWHSLDSIQFTRRVRKKHKDEQPMIHIYQRKGEFLAYQSGLTLKSASHSSRVVAYRFQHFQISFCHTYYNCHR